MPRRWGRCRCGLYGGERVRNAVVGAGVQQCRSDHHHPALIGCDLIEQGQNHRVDLCRFARSSGACNQQMRHFCKIGYHRLAADILSQRQWQAVASIAKGLRLKDFAQNHFFAYVIGQFYPDDRPARHRGDAGR